MCADNIRNIFQRDFKILGTRWNLYTGLFHQLLELGTSKDSTGLQSSSRSYAHLNLVPLSKH